MMATQAIYGLQKSPLLWYNEITLGFKNLGLVPVPDTTCLYKNDWLTVIIYVDDLISLYHPRHKSQFFNFEIQLLNIYEFRVIGDASYFLGIRIPRNRQERKLWLIQDSYIEKIAKKSNIINENPPKTPLPIGINWSPWNGTATSNKISAYQQRVSSNWFSSFATRLDISKVVSNLSIVLYNPSPEQAKAAEHCLNYLVSTKYLALQFDGLQQAQQIFTAYSDSAFADDQFSRSSSYGFCFALYGGPIYCKAVNSKTVTTSSTEAQQLAITLTAKEFIYWYAF